MRYIFSLIVFLFLFSCQEHKTIRNDNIYKIKDTLNYSDFQIIYNINEKDSYFSSFDSTFSKRYSHETKSTKLFLSVDDKRKIFQVIKSADIFGIPDILANSNKNCSLPSFSTSITVQIGQLKKSIYFDGYCEINDEDEAKRFHLIKTVISNIIYSKEEVKRMPESDIMYF